MDETPTVETTETVENSTPIEVPEAQEEQKEEVQPKVKMLMRTKYTYRVCRANSIDPIFEMSIVEKDPEMAGVRALAALQANVGDISQYQLHLKSLDILD